MGGGLLMSGCAGPSQGGGALAQGLRSPLWTLFNFINWLLSHSLRRRGGHEGGLGAVLDLASPLQPCFQLRHPPWPHPAPRP